MLDIPKLSNKPAVIRSFYAALSHQKSSGIHINNKLRGGTRYLYANIHIEIHTSASLFHCVAAIRCWVEPFFLPRRNLWSTPGDGCCSRSIQIKWLMLPTERRAIHHYWDFLNFYSILYSSAPLSACGSALRIKSVENWLVYWLKS